MSTELIASIEARLVVRKVTVSRKMDDHFVSLSTGVSEEDPGLTLEEGCLALLQVGHRLDKVVLERGFLSRTMPPDLLPAGLQGLNQLHSKYMAHRMLGGKTDAGGPAGTPAAPTA